MTNKEFDQALQEIEASATFPFSEHNWELLNKRLDNKKERQILLLLPLPSIKQWAAAACAGGLIIISSLYIYKTSTNTAHNTASMENARTVPQKDIQPAVDGNGTHTKKTIAKPSIAAVANVTNNITPQHSNKAQKAEPGNSNSSIEAPDNETHNDATEQIAKAFRETEHKPYYFMEELPAPSKKMGLALNGGIGVSGGGALAAGITFRNKLTRTISLETSIGYAQGVQNVLVKNETLAFDGGYHSSDTSHVMGVTSQESNTWYEQHKRTLPYLQFSPALSIKLNKRIHATIGIDLQRLLIDNRRLDDINEELRTSSKKLPQLDPGITSGISYAITKRIGAGIAYRQSAVNITNGKDYISRNYFLVQVQYSIIKQKP